MRNSSFALICEFVLCVNVTIISTKRISYLNWIAGQARSCFQTFNNRIYRPHIPPPNKCTMCISRFLCVNYVKIRKRLPRCFHRVMVTWVEDWENDESVWTFHSCFELSKTLALMGFQWFFLFFSTCIYPYDQVGFYPRSPRVFTFSCVSGVNDKPSETIKVESNI